MKFNLSRQYLTPEIKQIIAREIKRQKIQILKPTAKNLREFADICKAIKEETIPDHLICKKLPKHLGSGIFLKPNAKPIAKNTFIGPYSGIVAIVPQNDPSDSKYAFAPIVDIKLTKEEQAHFDPENVFRPNRLYALDVDAWKEGNYIRFVNHSHKPNVVAYLYKIPENNLGLEPVPMEVIYIALKEIKPGEQLLVSYDGDDDSYWKNLNIEPIPITPQTYMLDKNCKLITKN